MKYKNSKEPTEEQANCGEKKYVHHEQNWGTIHTMATFSLCSPMLQCFCEKAKINEQTDYKEKIYNNAKLTEPQIKKTCELYNLKKKSSLCSVPAIEGASCLVLYSLGLWEGKKHRGQDQFEPPPGAAQCATPSLSKGKEELCENLRISDVG